MIITDEQIADACNNAYLKAGHNAYFGNGFTMGVEFALTESKATEMFDMLIECKRVLDNVQSPATPAILLSKEIDKLVQKILQNETKSN